MGRSRRPGTARAGHPLAPSRAAAAPRGPRAGIPVAPTTSAADRSASTATGSRRPDSIASASRSTSRPARRPEGTIEGFDAVLPDADVDRLRLGRHICPQLGAAPLAEELDPQRRAGRHRRQDRSNDDADLGAAVGQRRGQAAAGRGSVRYRAAGRRRPRPRHRRQRPDHPEPEARREPADVIDRLHEVRRIRRAGLVVGARR